MANRAYLWSSDRPDDWTFPFKDYYDSRHTIPIAWFFFYQQSDIRIVEVKSRGSHWQEVKLSAEKETALSLFLSREVLLKSLVGSQIRNGLLAEFLETVKSRPGRFLLMDPEEVLSGDDSTDTAQFSQILGLIGAEKIAVADLREALQPYTGDFSPDADRYICQTLGWTYCWDR